MNFLDSQTSPLYHSDTKEHYQTCVNSIFEQSWWLDALAPGQWSEVVVKNGTDIVAKLPYVIKKKYGLTILTQPPLTPGLGPWLRPSKAKYSNQLSEQKKLMTALIDQLPEYDYFCQNFHHSITNCLPFYWRGFTHTTYCTYIIKDPNELELVWTELKQSTRTSIRKAQKQLTVRTDIDIEQFLDIQSLTYQRQGLSFPYSRELVRRLDAACAERQARLIFGAADAQGRIHAVNYVVWDENSVYGLMCGADPEHLNSGASNLLKWEAIKYAAKINRTFNFCGSMLENIESNNRSFGAKQIPYFFVNHMSRRMKLLMAANDIVKALVSPAK